MDACCAVPANECRRPNDDSCVDRTSSSDWLFGLWPGPPQRFEPTGTDTTYQRIYTDAWPLWGIGGAIGGDWGNYGDLAIGTSTNHEAPEEASPTPFTLVDDGSRCTSRFKSSRADL